MLTRLRVLLSRLRALLAGSSTDVDFEEEIGEHLALLTEEYLARGLSAGAARRAARVRFGGAMQIQEQQRELRGVPGVDMTLQDVRYTLRALRKHPLYTLTAVVTLAVGIGAGTAMFSIARAVLLRPLPYAEPGALVRVFETNPLKGWTRSVAAPANYADWKARNTVFTDVAAYEQFSNTGGAGQDVFLTGHGEPQALTALRVTGNLFKVLGAAPLMGRTFADEETYDGHGRVVVLSYGLWQSAFAADPAIVGRTVTLSGRTCDVVGVMPPGFFFPARDIQAWMPVGYETAVFTSARRPHWLGAIARRRPGVSLDRAQDEMNTIARDLERAYPDTNTEMGVRLEPWHASLAYEQRPALVALGCAVGLLFLVVCANVANLQLGRASARGREFAIRRALGAARGRLVRQLLTESLVLSAIAGAIGLVVAALARTALLQLAPSAIPLHADVRVDRIVVLFGGLLTLAAPLLFGLVPALQSARPGGLNMRTEAGPSDTRLFRHALIGVEVALSIVLVAGAVLFTRSLIRLQQVDPGFDPSHAVAFDVTLPSARYPKLADRVRAFEAIEHGLKRQAGVQAAGAASTLALRGATWTGDATIEGRSAGDYQRELRHKSVTPGYFEAMGVKLLAGRQLDDHDTADRPPVALVNLALARKYFPGADAVGRRLKFGRPQDPDPWVTIAGIVADEQQDAMDRTAEPQAYQSLRQEPERNSMTFVVRSTLDPEASIAAARREVQSVDRDLVLTSVTTLDAVVNASTGDHRFRTVLISAFAGVALFLAALGIYGVLAYLVTQRGRELGIRLALGAKPRALFAMIVAQGMRPAAIGAAVGLAGAVGSTALVRSLVFGVEPMDPTTYILAALLLLSTAFAACAVPAWRATQLDPLAALRDE